MTDTDHYVIPRHKWRPLLDLLDEIPAVLEDLAITITRQDRIGAGSLGKSGDPTQPLPINLAASDALEDLHGELQSWARHTAQHRGLYLWTIDDRVVRPDFIGPLWSGWRRGHPDVRHDHVGPLRPGQRRHNPEPLTALQLAAWLSWHLIDLALTPEADLAHDRIERYIRDCRRSYDRPADPDVLIGYCGECRNPVKGKLGQAIQRCQTCGVELTEDQVYADIDNGMAQVALTAKEAAHLINLRYGANIKPKTVYDMAYRKTSPIQAVPLSDGGVAFWMREVVGDLRTKGKIA